jgi:allantoin racemase
MKSSVYVINPNSSEKVTSGIDAAVAPLRSADGPDIVCLSLPEGPPGIQSQRDVDGVIGPILRKAATLEEDAGAFVIACFSDPGLFALREQSRRRVFGIAECGVLTALSLGQRFGVIAILPTSIPRHLRYFGAMGVTQRLAADLPIGLGVAELSDESRTLSRMVAPRGSRRRPRGRADPGRRRHGRRSCPPAASLRIGHPPLRARRQWSTGLCTIS